MKPRAHAKGEGVPLVVVTAFWVGIHVPVLARSGLERQERRAGGYLLRRSWVEVSAIGATLRMMTQSFRAIIVASLKLHFVSDAETSYLNSVRPNHAIWLDRGIFIR